MILSTDSINDKWWKIRNSVFYICNDIKKQNIHNHIVDVIYQILNNTSNNFWDDLQN